MQLPTCNLQTSFSDLFLWQLADSAFPTGGFAHSNGLEAALQHGEVGGYDGLRAFIATSLHQAAHAALPFALAAWDGPADVDEIDTLCDSFLTNHVANRASRAQGRAFQTSVERIFPVLERGIYAASTSDGTHTQKPSDAGPPHTHFAPVFGATLRRLEVARETAARLFLFFHVRGLLAAAVRLNIVGPIEAQRLQFAFSDSITETARQCGHLTLNDIAQTAPLLDLWQGAHDRLYSRLFQS